MKAITKAGKAMENKLVALIKKHGKVRVIASRPTRLGWAPSQRDRVLYKTGLCTYRMGDQGRRARSCFNKSGAIHCLDWIKDPVRRAVRSMMEYDQDFRKVTSIYIGNKLDKAVK